MTCKQGLHVQRQAPIRIRYEGLVFEEGFRADLLVEDKVIVELKSVEKLIPVHSKAGFDAVAIESETVGIIA